MSENLHDRKFKPSEMTADDIVRMAKEQLGLELNASNAGYCLTFMQGMSTDEMSEAMDKPTDFISTLIERLGGMNNVVNDEESEEVIPLLDALEKVKTDPEEGLRLLHAASGTDGIRKATKRILNRQPIRNDTAAPGRNDACPCGSGKKFKKCCANK